MMDTMAFNLQPAAAVPGSFEPTVNTSDSTYKGDCKDLQWYTGPVEYTNSHRIIGAWARSSVKVLAKSLVSSTACGIFIPDRFIS